MPTNRSSSRRSSPAASHEYSWSSAPRCVVVKRWRRSSARSWRTPKRSTCLQRLNSRPHERELDRTTKLVGIGAASQQELERLHAEHAAKLAGVQSLRSRLVLLGMPAPAIDALAPGRDVEATTNIPAPIAGVITERGANVGLNVDTAMRLFTVVDLSTVWAVGALYEKDFSHVLVGI